MTVRPFDTAQLDAMRAVQESSMMDTCQLLTYAQEVIGYRRGQGTFTAGEEMACGFHEVSGREVQEAGQVSIITARLRLPVGTEVKNTDRVRITKRHGEALEPAADYQIVGDVRRGPSGLQLDLATVTHD